MLKKAFLSLFLFCAFQNIYAQRGIQFLTNKNFNQAIALAKQQNKLLFVEAYAPDCHVCQSFKGTFAQPQVGALYNAKFINYQLDLRQQMNYQILRQLKIIINATPTFLFFDPKTMKLVQARIFGEGENSVINVNSIGQKAANTAEHYDKMAERLKKGEKNPGFLLNYAEIARISGDTLTNIKALNEYIKLIPANQYSSRNSFNFLGKSLMNNENPLFDYFVSNLGVYQRQFDANSVRMTYENIFQIVLTSSQANKMSNTGLQKLKIQMKKVGLDDGSIVRRTWMVECGILFKAKKNKEALAIIQKVLDALPSAPGPKEYQFLCDFIKSKTKDPKTIQFAKKNYCAFGTK
ncbi:thioredoxin family protein [Sandaracinomonas limnophila]|uniref:Thioredoxin family protein n=1 Tax=Sandaracinomonas limnophila TaxID=1862386 RepID=A0A437PWJ1_9BACT|nr:thioredoxin family protein [Sandaracinomonas limnophila]RVU26602.1 thioredoxin family protein [Sandaracinomonas limnophila]